MRCSPVELRVRATMNSASPYCSISAAGERGLRPRWRDHAVGLLLQLLEQRYVRVVQSDQTRGRTCCAARALNGDVATRPAIDIGPPY